jgi:hypothetical protein
MPPTKEELYALKCKVNLLYDMQKLRMQSEGRINRAANPIILTEKDKLFLTSTTKDLAKMERKVELAVEHIVKAHPMWKDFFEKVRGVGPKGAGILLACVDINKCRTPSALWMFSGLGVVPHVKCSKCGHESWHNKGTCQKVVGDGKICGGVTAPVDGKKGIQRRISGERIGYNQFLKTKLLGVIAPNFIKLSSEYRKHYDNYKDRLNSGKWGKTQKHRHNAALRYMMKMFLIDMWKKWRELEGLPVREAYAVEYLGKHQDNQGEKQ